MREPLHWTHDALASVPIYTIARRRRKIGERRAAVEPVGKERGYDRVADREFGHAVADRFDNSRAIRHWNAAVIGAQATCDDTQIVGIERTRVDAHADFTRRWRTRIGKLRAFEVFQSGGLAQDNGFH
jgi:hypothetical protein